ncbi:MAG: tetratricopeptide repeat protein [Thermodesulfobacteriota bacterium]
MTLRRVALLAVCLMIGGIMGGLSLMACGPTGTPPKAEKDSKVTLSPQAMEHFRQGHKFLAEQKLPEALKEFQETARLATESPLAQFWVGKVYFFQKDREQAEKSFKRVLQLEPKNYHAMAMLGRLYSFDRDKLDQAQQYLQQALDESPDNLEAHFDMGRIYAMKGDKQRAIREMAFIFNKEREFALYHFEMGRILEAWGEKAGALEHYKRALVLNPKFEPAEQAIKHLQDTSRKDSPSSAPAATGGKTSPPPATPGRQPATTR